MKVWKNEFVTLPYEYSFAVHGGAIGNIALGNLPEGFILQSIAVVIEETLTSGGVPTLELGEDGGGDDNGYVEDFGGTLSAGSAIKGAGALISDNFHQVAAAKDGLVLKVGANALTAGKFRVYASGFQA